MEKRKPKLNKNKRMKILTWAISPIGTSVCLLFFLIVAFNMRDKNRQTYEIAMQDLEQKNYKSASEILEQLGDYKDAKEKKYQAELLLSYENAEKMIENENYEQAIKEFEKIIDFQDSEERIKQACYYMALTYLRSQEYDLAKTYFIKADGYEDSKVYLSKIELDQLEQSLEIVYEKAIQLYEQNNYTEAIELFSTLKDYKNSESYAKKCKNYIRKEQQYKKAVRFFKEEKYDKALKKFDSIQDYKESREYTKKCKLYLRRMDPNNRISAGIRNSIAITNEHTVYTKGEINSSQYKATTWADIVSIDSYGAFIIGLDKNGQARVAGEYYDGELSLDDRWETLTDVAAGQQFVVGLRKDRTVVATGHNGNRQCEVDDWKDVIAIDAGWSFAVALTKDKELLFAGKYNNQKQDFENKRDEWKNVVNIAASGGGKGDSCRGKGHTVGLCKDGTVVAVGDNDDGQCDVYTKEWTNIVKVAAGDNYTVGLKENGTIVITGKNEPGSRYIEDDKIKQCVNIVDIATCFGHTLCLTKEGRVIAFGYDQQGQYEGVEEEWHDLLVP